MNIAISWTIENVWRPLKTNLIDSFLLRNTPGWWVDLKQHTYLQFIIGFITDSGYTSLQYCENNLTIDKGNIFLLWVSLIFFLRVPFETLGESNDFIVVVVFCTPRPPPHAHAQWHCSSDKKMPHSNGISIKITETDRTQNHMDGKSLLNGRPIWTRSLTKYMIVSRWGIILRSTVRTSDISWFPYLSCCKMDPRQTHQSDSRRKQPRKR